MIFLISESNDIRKLCITKLFGLITTMSNSAIAPMQHCFGSASLDSKNITYNKQQTSDYDVLKNRTQQNN